MKPVKWLVVVHAVEGFIFEASVFFSHELRAKGRNPGENEYCFFLQGLLVLEWSKLLSSLLLLGLVISWFWYPHPLPPPQPPTPTPSPTPI